MIYNCYLASPLSRVHTIRHCLTGTLNTWHWEVGWHHKRRNEKKTSGNKLYYQIIFSYFPCFWLSLPPSEQLKHYDIWEKCLTVEHWLLVWTEPKIVDPTNASSINVIGSSLIFNIIWISSLLLQIQRYKKAYYNFINKLKFIWNTI